jgi:uncharacterized protein (TIGR03067 family)
MRVTVLLLAVALPAAAGGKDDAVKAELGRLKGAWQATAVEQDGKRATDDVAKQMRLVFDGEELTVFAGDTVLMRGAAQLDPGAKPKALTLASTAGRLKGQTVEGIYELDGDALTVCLGPPGGPRPAGFKSGKDQPLVVCKRAKP